MSETTQLVTTAKELYADLDMDALPPALQRDSIPYYYLSVYPGMQEMRDATPETLPKLPDRVNSIYMHTPYCTGVCDFCSYFLTTVDPDDRSPITDYLELAKKEAGQHSDQTDLDISYLYFGGGTPSLIPPRTLEGFLQFLDEKGALNKDLHGTLELHPEFFSNLSEAQAFIDVLRAYNIGRVSIGFESADETILDDYNRRHNNAFLDTAFDFLRQNGMLVNLDLMYGLPGLSNERWEATLNTALSYIPDSLSTYFLFVDPGTVTHREVRSGIIKLPSHETVQVQHLMAQLALEGAGYHELPNDFYAKVDDPTMFVADTLPSDLASLPIGAGGYGFYDNTQFFTQFSLAGYRAKVANGESTISRLHRFDDEGLMRRDVMFGFKNSPYLNLALFRNKYGEDPLHQFPETFELLDRLGMVTVDESRTRASLTRKGRLCVEEIAGLFRIPGLSPEVGRNRQVQQRITKHNFAPTYPTLDD